MCDHWTSYRTSSADATSVSHVCPAFNFNGSPNESFSARDDLRSGFSHVPTLTMPSWKTNTLPEPVVV
ncbi:MAG: hypothetical protein R3B12_02320 [Candidatus Saccharimonadales bacterium]